MQNKTIIIIQALLLILFGVLFYHVVSGEIYLDTLMNTFFQDNYTENGKQFFIIIADIGDKWGVIILGLLASAYFYYKKYFSKITVLISTMVLGVGCSTILKHIIARERPSNMIIEYGGYSFPSGHSVFAVLFYGLLVYLFWDTIRRKKFRNFMLILAIIVGVLVMISRLYLSVHYVSDVFTGAIIGLFWLLFGVLLYRRLKK